MIVLLKPAELLLHAINSVRRSLYRRGVLRGERLPRPVVSIGNIAIGGAGKTPAVIALAQHLSRSGLEVAVLTRGYGRADTGVTGEMDSVDAARWGDEPALIKRDAPNVHVIVGSKRAINGAAFIARKDVDVFILDDGFQHLQLARDIDIVIDVPASLHREPRSALRDATFVIPRRLETSGGELIAGKRAFAFAGLADNRQFFETVRLLGADLVGTRSFPDHHRYSSADLEELRLAARNAGAEVIVTTAKDEVKFPGAPGIVTIGSRFVFPPGVLEAVTARIVELRSGTAAGALL